MGSTSQPDRVDDILCNIQNISDPEERLRAKKRARQQLRDKLKRIDSKIERLENQDSENISNKPQEEQSDKQFYNTSKTKKPKVSLKTVESPKKVSNIQKKFDILSYGEPFLPTPSQGKGWAERFYWTNDGVYLPFPLGYKARRYVHGYEHIMEIQKDKASLTPIFYVHIRKQDFFSKAENEEDTSPDESDDSVSEALSPLPENTELGETYVSFYNKTSSGVWQNVVDFWNQKYRKTNSKHRVSGPLYFGFKEQHVKDQLYHIMKNVSQFIPESIKTKLHSQHVRIPPPLALSR